MDYRIPYAPPDITEGVKLLLGTLKNNREQDRADYNTQINATNANNAFVKESAQAARESELATQRREDRTRRQGIADADALGTVDDLIKSARHVDASGNVTLDQGKLSHAMALGKAHGIDVRQRAAKIGEEDGAKAGAGQPPVAAPAQAAPPALSPLLQAAMPPQPEPAPSPTVGTAGYGQPTGREDPSASAAMNNPLSFHAEHGIDATTVPEDQAPMRDFAGPAPSMPPGNTFKMDEPLVITAGEDQSPGVQLTSDRGPPPAATPAVMRSNPLFEAVMGGQTYPLGGQGNDSTGLGPEYDKLYAGLVDAGYPDKQAREFVIKQYHSDKVETGKDNRLANVIAGRQQHDATYGMTAEQRQANFDARLAMMEKVARIHAAATGNTATPAAVAHLVGMKEAGASDEEIFSEAAKAHLPEKQYLQPVQNVVRNAAAGERAGQKREQLAGTDLNGKPIVWASSTDAREGKAQNEAFSQVKLRMDDLIAHVKQYGARIDPDTQQYQDRLSLGAAVNAALRPYNKLGGTDASQRLESDITGALGAPGHGWLLGANLTGLERILNHAEQRHDTMIQQRTRPEGGSSLAPALGGPRRGAPPAHPAEESVGTTRKVGDKTYRKVGPNNWQPVAP